MKTVLTLVGGGMILAGTAVAGPQEILKQRAKELNNQNNVRQGVAPPAQAAAPAQTAAAPAATPAVNRLQADLAAIKAGSPVTPALKQQLVQDLLAVAQGVKPTASAPKVAECLANAFAERPLSGASRARLVQEIDAVLNPAKYPNAKMEGIFADVQAIFQEREDSPMAAQSRKKAQTIADAVRAMAAEVQRGGR